MKAPSIGDTMNAMEFRDGDRAFICSAGPSPATPGTLWWWINVTGDGSRYAAFRTQPDDTPANLRPRIVAYYEQLLADRSRPVAPRSAWGRRPASPAVAADSAAADAAVDAVIDEPIATP